VAETTDPYDNGASQILAALAEAHEKGIIHRD
jgi:serine/threonine protein kinase